MADMFVVYTAHLFLNSEGCVLKQSLPLLNKTTVLNLAESFIGTFIFVNSVKRAKS